MFADRLRSSEDACVTRFHEFCIDLFRVDVWNFNSSRLDVDFPNWGWISVADVYAFKLTLVRATCLSSFCSRESRLTFLQYATGNSIRKCVFFFVPFSGSFFCAFETKSGGKKEHPFVVRWIQWVPFENVKRDVLLKYKSTDYATDFPFVLFTCASHSMGVASIFVMYVTSMIYWCVYGS